MSEGTPVTIDKDPYPEMFRTYVTRGLRATLESLDTPIERLDDAQRERGLHLLSYGLRLDAAWQDVRDLALTLAPHLERQGYRRAWIELLEQALEQAITQNDQHGATQLHLQLGRLHTLLGDFAAADEQLLKMKQLAAAMGDQHLQAVALGRLGHSAFERSDLSAARAYAEASLALLPSDDAAAASNWHLLGLVALRQGDIARSAATLQQALTINRSHGNQQGVMIVLRELGVTYWHGKHFDLAITVLAEAVALSMEVGDIFGEATTRMNLGIAYWYRGDYEQAMAAYAPCEAIFRKIASRSYLARLYNNQGLVYRELGEIARARECFNSSLNLTRSENDHLETASVLDSLAGLWQRVGSTREALATWQEALSELERLPEAPRFLYNLIQERMEAARLTEQVDGFPAPENHPLTGYDGRA